MNNKIPTIQELVEHIKLHKDAVVIIGEKVAPELGVNLVSDEDGERIFNKKAMVKQPDEFWQFYFDNIKQKENTFLATPVVYTAVKDLKNKQLVSKVIATNTHGMPICDINLKGTSNKIICNKCGNSISNITLEELKDNKYKCECGNRLRPECLLYGENYHPANMRSFVSAIFNEEEGKETLPNTHTIILIGVDMAEDLISEMYDNYLLVRERTKDNCYLVMITDKEEDIRLFTPEFATSVDIDGATKRLVDLFK